MNEEEYEGQSELIADLDAFPLSDVIVATKNAQRAGEKYQGRSREPAPGEGDEKGDEIDPTMLADEARIYPYTKGIELTNDGVGYGEQVTVVVLKTKKGTPGSVPANVETVERFERRTRSGSRFLIERGNHLGQKDRLLAPDAVPDLAMEFAGPNQKL